MPMRARASKDGLTVRVIAGTHAALLAFDLADPRRVGCLGFSIERTDVETGDRRWLPNSLRFMSDPNPEWITTARAPLQKFRWGDYTTEPGRLYRYRVVARYGTPAEVLAQGLLAERPGGFDAVPGGVSLELRTEDSRNAATSIFFNRGAAASQAYIRKFGDNDPDDIPEALTWLSRGLEEGLVAFIAKADGPDYVLHGCIYEFEKPTPIRALIQAHKRGADVHIVYHARKGGNTAEENRHAIADLGVTFKTTPRAKGSALMHNKYLVLLRKGADGVARPVAVWTGGTNWTEGGIYGQLNVGHAIYDPAIAERYEAGFQVLAQDLSIDETQARNDVITPLPAPTRAGLAHGTTPLFSPQNGLGMIDLYADICRTAKVLMISAPFALHERIRNVLDSPSQGAMRFMLADKEGSFGEKGNIDRLNADPGAMAAVAKPFEGIKLTEFQKRKLDRDRMMMDEGFHHAGIHIHSKMILADPFGADPVLVTGSANFSVNSTINNDSNVLVFRGDTAVADVYVADFMRMFEHYWFRSRKDAKLEANQIFALKDTDAWSERYFTEGAREQRDRLAFLGLAT
jgi:phosphatidylserine/phosphatidylglycerophosphate/cardiolipin synthase-like enzyme